jgi:spore maturation protein SpmB
MIPVLLFVKLLEELGAIEAVGKVLDPIMSIVGLPAELGVVWASAMVTNIYGGLIMFIGLPDIELNVAQATTLGGMLLISHGLILEGAVANRVGMKFIFHIILRFSTGLLYGMVMINAYSFFNTGQEVVSFRWQPDIIDTSHLLDWLLFQTNNLLLVEGIILALIILIRFLDLIGVNRVLEHILLPLFNIFGLSRNTAPMVTVGISMGLAYGGGLLMREVERGVIKRRDIFVAVCFISLFHSVIEDTLAVMVLGGELIGLLWIRLAISVIVTYLIARLVDAVDENTLNRLFFSIPEVKNCPAKS